MRYAIGLGLAPAVWLASLAVPLFVQPWIWVVALLVDLFTPLTALLVAVGRPYDVNHIPERYGLFTLIVLGEAIIAVARGTAESDWTPAAIITAVSGFAMAVVIWWAYFAHPHAEVLERGRAALFVWGYGHIVVWAGIAITGVGIDLAIESAATGHDLDTPERLILCGGPALYLTAMAVLRSAGAGHITDPVVLFRLAAAMLLLVIGLAGGSLAAEAITFIVAAIAVGAGIAIHVVWESAITGSN
jgi:low temperature requirement protein LtrA